MIATSARPMLRMLTEEQCETIHRASLEILRRTGVRIFHEEALDLLRESDSVFVDGNRVFFQPSLVEAAVAGAPPRIPLCFRGSDRVSAPLEGRAVSFGTGSDCLNILDPRTGKKRLFTSSDLEDCARLVDALPDLQFCMSMGVPSDLNKDNCFRDQFALMLQNTSKPVVFVCDDRADCEAIVAMATAAAGDIEHLRLHPSLLLYSEPSSPLKHTETAIGKVLYMAEQGLPIVHSPAPVQGASGPVTLAGALAMANAEVLSGLVIHQLKRPGAPMVYGCGMHHMDMKSAVAVFTSPEFLLARIAVAEMGRFYDMPTWGYAGDSNSAELDEQAAAEIALTVILALLAGNNLVHDVGYLETGLTCSPESMVLASEVISMSRKVMEGVALDSESFALDTIHEVGPDGDFLTADHTLHHFRCLWRPALFRRLVGEQWIKRGSPPLRGQLREKTVAILEEHRPEPLADSIKEDIQYILKNSN